MKKRKVVVVDKLTDKLSDFSTQLAVDVEALVLGHVDELFEAARERALAELCSLIAGWGMSPEPEQPAPVVHRDIKPSKSPPAVTEAPKKRGCSKCGQPGHYASSCTSADEEQPKVRRLTAKPEALAARRDAIAKRAGSLPTPSASFEVD